MHREYQELVGPYQSSEGLLYTSASEHTHHEVSTSGADGAWSAEFNGHIPGLFFSFSFLYFCYLRNGNPTTPRGMMDTALLYKCSTGLLHFLDFWKG